MTPEQHGFLLQRIKRQEGEISALMYYLEETNRMLFNAIAHIAAGETEPLTSIARQIETNMVSIRAIKPQK